MTKMWPGWNVSPVGARKKFSPTDLTGLIGCSAGHRRRGSSRGRRRWHT